MLYIWLKKGAEEQLVAFKDQGFLGDVKVVTHYDSGKKYISFEDVFDPTLDVNIIPEELIEKVTFKDRIYQGFRTDGIYQHEGAILLLKTEFTVYSKDKEKCQDISVAASNVEKLKAIYTLVRQNKLAPQENWGDIHSSLPTCSDETETEMNV